MGMEPGQEAGIEDVLGVEGGPAALWQLIGKTVMLLNWATPQGIVRRYPGAVLSLSGEPVTNLNFAIIEDVTEGEMRLREFHVLTQELGLPTGFFLWPGSRKLLSVAQSLGLQLVGAAPLMVNLPREAPPQSPDFKIDIVADEATLEQSMDLMIRGFSLPREPVLRTYGRKFLDTPGYEGYVASQAGVPMGTGWTVRFGPIVGIYSMATPPEYQRRGAARAVISAMIGRHLASGAQLFYLGATEAGFPLYDRLGFRTVQEMPIWVSGTLAQSFQP